MTKGEQIAVGILTLVVGGAVAAAVGAAPRRPRKDRWRLRVLQGDAGVQSVLTQLERNGTVHEMVLWDGENLIVDWQAFRERNFPVQNWVVPAQDEVSDVARVGPNGEWKTEWSRPPKDRWRLRLLQGDAAERSVLAQLDREGTIHAHHRDGDQLLVDWQAYETRNAPVQIWAYLVQDEVGDVARLGPDGKWITDWWDARGRDE